MLKRLLFSILLVICFPFNLFSRVASQAEVQRLAEQIVIWDNAHSGLRNSKELVSIVTLSVLIHETEPVGYLAELHPHGFMILSDITELAPVRFISYDSSFSNIRGHALIQQILQDSLATKKVLGYSPTSIIDSLSSPAYLDNIDTNQLAENKRLWQIQLQGSSLLSSEPAAASSGPLLTSRWNQDDPYNLYTPPLVDSSGRTSRPLTGSVATAMAQIMYYWKHPLVGQGNISYIWTKGNKTLSMTFNSVYDWASMLDRYDGSATIQQQSAVATLLRDVGYSVETDYGLTDSGASPQHIAPSLKAFFGYSSEASLISRTVPSNAWFRLFQDQIDKRWPALLALYSTSLGGHAVVVDGYRTDAGNQVHINMGRGGNNDSYYSLDSILAFDNIYSQQAVININPLPDTMPPALNIASVKDGDAFWKPVIAISGTASDFKLGNNGISSVTVNGIRADGDTATGVDTASWSLLLTLQSGANTINVTATDGSQNYNKSSKSLTLYYVPNPTLSLSMDSVSFNYEIGTSQLPSQTVILSSYPIGMTFTVSTSTADNLSWLQASADQSTTPGKLSVNVNPALLAPGIYKGTVTVFLSETTVNKTISVTLTVGSRISFSHQINFDYPPAKCFNLTLSPGSSFAVTKSDHTWLSIAPAQGISPAQICISVNPNGLEAGDYSAAATISLGPIQLDVSLKVLPAPVLLLNATSFEFVPRNGSYSQQKLSISSSNPDKGLGFSSQISAGTDWLHLDPQNGSAPANLVLWVTPEQLRPGIYSASISIWLERASNSPLILKVSLTVPDSKMILRPQSLTFNYERGGALPAPQSVSIRADMAGGGGARIAFSASAVAAWNGNAWLSVAPSGDTTPAVLTASLGYVNLDNGTYSGSIDIYADGASNCPLSIPVILTVSNPRIVTDPRKPLLNYPFGSSSPLSLNMKVSSSTGMSISSFKANVSSGSDWLAVEAGTGGVAQGSIKLLFNGQKLSKGIYHGSVLISADGFANSPLVVPVTVNVRNRATIFLRPASLSFTCHEGGPAPPEQTIAVSGEATRFNTSISTSSGGNWLSVSSSQGTTPTVVSVSADSGNLTPGSYEGTVKIDAPDSLNLSASVKVILTVSKSPSPVPRLASINLQAPSGSSVPVATELSVDSNGNQVRVYAYASKGDWLAVAPNLFTAVSGSLTATPAKINVYANPSSLLPGSYAGEITFYTDYENPAVLVPVTFTIMPKKPNLTISQVADGGGWQSTIMLVNTGMDTASFNLVFRRVDGSPLSLPLIGIGKVQEYAGNIPVGGTSFIQTEGSDTTLSQGSAELSVNGSIGGTSVFRQRTNDTDSEAAVPISVPLGKQIIFPFDNTDGFATAMAILNSSQSSSTLATNVRDENGKLLSSGSLALPPRSRNAAMLSEQWQATTDKRGLIQLSSNGADLAAFGLRFNPRGAFSSFQPVVPEAEDKQTMSRTISQIADGQNWKTTFVLVNVSQQEAPFTLAFRQADGGAVAVPLEGCGNVNEYADTIPAGGLRILESEGTSNTLKQGWAELVSSKPIAGTVVFRQRSSSGLDSEGTVSIDSSRAGNSVLPFDHTEGNDTALAILNSSVNEAVITAVVRDQSGQFLSSEILRLPSGSRKTFFLTAQYPATKERRGSIELSGSGISLLGLRFNPLGSFNSIAPIPK